MKKKIVYTALIVSIPLLLVTFTNNSKDKIKEIFRLPVRIYASFVPPEGGMLEGLAAKEKQVISSLSEKLNGMIVWSSNRSGNHELYLIDLNTSEVKQLTSNEYVDYYSKFSPDGKKIVFMRSVRPWVSFRKKDSWDIYIIDVDGKNERLLARQGYMPSWTSDGKGIVFLRGYQVLKIDMVSKKEEILFNGNKEPTSGKIEDPKLYRDSKLLALSVKSAFNGVGIVDLNSMKMTPVFSKQACQVEWSPDYSSLMWVAKGGNGGTQIMKSNIPKIDPQVFMDLPGEYSHEYFPRLSNDGNWLIWGASAGGHEHDRADYEIFLWKVGAPWDKAVRLTYYKGNDQWPDIFVLD